MKQPNLKTFDDWKTCGRYVVKGQKAHSFNEEGKALFDISQTDKKVYRVSSWGYVQETDYYKPDIEPKESDTVYYADGSGYRKGGGPCGPLYFDKFGNT